MISVIRVIRLIRVIRVVRGDKAPQGHHGSVCFSFRDIISGKRTAVTLINASRGHFS